MAEKKEKNYLELIPVRSGKYTWEDECGVVTIRMTHTGVYDRIAQKLFRTPAVSRVELDAYGSFLWREIDGTRCVGELGDLLRGEYGEAAEPLYDRLVRYLQILRNNGFILFRGRDRGAGA